MSSVKILKDVNIDDVKPYENNYLKHDNNVDHIANSIKDFGYNKVSIGIDDKGEMIYGHGTLQALKQLEMKIIPAVAQIDGLTEKQKKAYRIADNESARKAEIDFGILEMELPDFEDEFDLADYGFDVPEIDVIENEPEEEDEFDAEEEAGEIKEPIAVLGDVWTLGKHRLTCGDSTLIDDVEKLMNGEKADMVFTDPPYGIGINFTGGPSGNGLCEKQDYGKIKGDESTEVAEDAINLALSLFPDATHVYWGANYYSNLKPSKCWISWYKKDELPDDTFCDTELAWTNAKKHSKTICVQWKGMIKEGEAGQKRVHPTQKPVLLAEKCFDYLNAGEKVLDLFGGSGSTLIACEQLNRKCYMMELDEKYVSVIIFRWIKYMKKLGKEKEIIVTNNGETIDYLDLVSNVSEGA